MILIITGVVFWTLIVAICAHICGQVSTAKRAIEKGYIDNNGRLYFVIDWPKYDEESWVKFMSKVQHHEVHGAMLEKLGKEIGIDIPSYDRFAYLQDWAEYQKRQNNKPKEG